MLTALRRWRTWIFNTAVTALLATGELMVQLDTGFDWREVIPPKYVPYAILAFALVNIWMRPRPAAVRPREVDFTGDQL